SSSRTGPRAGSPGTSLARRLLRGAARSRRRFGASIVRRTRGSVRAVLRFWVDHRAARLAAAVDRQHQEVFFDVLLKRSAHPVRFISEKRVDFLIHLGAAEKCLIVGGFGVFDLLV